MNSTPVNVARELTQFPELVTYYQGEAKLYEAEAEKILKDAEKYRNMIPQWEAKVRESEQRCVERRNQRVRQ